MLLNVLEKYICNKIFVFLLILLSCNCCESNIGEGVDYSIPSNAPSLIIETSGMVPVADNSATTTGVYIYNNTDTTINNISYSTVTTPVSTNNAFALKSGQCTEIPSHSSCFLSFTTPVLSFKNNTTLGSALIVAKYQINGTNKSVSSIINFAISTRDDITLIAPQPNSLGISTIYLYNGSTKSYKIKDLISNVNSNIILNRTLLDTTIDSHQIIPIEAKVRNNNINTQLSFNLNDLIPSQTITTNTVTLTTNPSNGPILYIAQIPTLPNSSLSESIVIVNIGNKSTGAINISSTNQDATVYPSTCDSLQPQSNCIVTLTILPNTTALESTTITVSDLSNPLDSYSATAIWYNPTTAPEISSVVQSVSGLNNIVTITNIGGQTLNSLTLSAVNKSGIGVESITSIYCQSGSMSIPVNESCSFLLNFSESVVATPSYSGKLAIQINGNFGSSNNFQISQLHSYTVSDPSNTVYMLESTLVQQFTKNPQESTLSGILNYPGMVFVPGESKGSLIFSPVECVTPYCDNNYIIVHNSQYIVSYKESNSDLQEESKLIIPSVNGNWNIPQKMVIYESYIFMVMGPQYQCTTFYGYSPVVEIYNIGKNGLITYIDYFQPSYWLTAGCNWINDITVESNTDGSAGLFFTQAVTNYIYMESISNGNLNLIYSGVTSTDSGTQYDPGGIAVAGSNSFSSAIEFISFWAQVLNNWWITPYQYKNNSFAHFGTSRYNNQNYKPGYMMVFPTSINSTNPTGCLDFISIYNTQNTTSVYLNSYSYSSSGMSGQSTSPLPRVPNVGYTNIVQYFLSGFVSGGYTYIYTSGLSGYPYFAKESSSCNIIKPQSTKRPYTGTYAGILATNSSPSSPMLYINESPSNNSLGMINIYNKFVTDTDNGAASARYSDLSQNSFSHTDNTQLLISPSGTIGYITDTNNNRVNSYLIANANNGGGLTYKSSTPTASSSISAMVISPVTTTSNNNIVYYVAGTTIYYAQFNESSGLYTGYGSLPITGITSITSLAISPFNTFLYVATNSGVYLYNINSDGSLALSSSVNQPVLNVRSAGNLNISPNGLYLSLSYYNNVIGKLYISLYVMNNLSQGSLSLISTTALDSISFPIFTPNSNYIIYSYSGQINKCPVTTGLNNCPYLSTTSTAQYFSTSNDGNYLFRSSGVAGDISQYTISETTTDNPASTSNGLGTLEYPSYPSAGINYGFTTSPYVVNLQ